MSKKRKKLKLLPGKPVWIDGVLLVIDRRAKATVIGAEKVTDVPPDSKMTKETLTVQASAVD